MIFCFFGQSGSGKTSLANAFKNHLLNNKITDFIHHIDGDEIRKITENYDYSEAGRHRNLKDICRKATYLSQKDIDVLISAVAPFQKYRDEIRWIGGKLIYIHTSDIRGRESYHVSNFEMPSEDEKCIVIDTTGKTVEESLNELLYKINISR